MIAWLMLVFLTLNAMALLFGITLGRAAHHEDRKRGWAHPEVPQPRAATHDVLDLTSH